MSLTDEQIINLARQGFVLKDDEIRRLGDLVATEPDRTRAAVVKWLRYVASNATEKDTYRWLSEQADKVENGREL